MKRLFLLPFCFKLTALSRKPCKRQIPADIDSGITWKFLQADLSAETVADVLKDFLPVHMCRSGDAYQAFFHFTASNIWPSFRGWTEGGLKQTDCSRSHG